MQLRRGVLLGRPLGIPLLIHGSWFPAAVLLVSHLVLTVYADLRIAPAVTLGLASGTLFFTSLVAHELGHAVTARALGIHVQDITLFVFGGVARIAKEPTRPAQEFVIALAGPLVSVAIGSAFLFGAGRTTELVERFLWTIGASNLALAGFNLLPGFPLDGGRILRAFLWRRSGDPHRATLVAARTGQLIGLVLVAAGMILFIGEQAERLNGGTAEGLWLAVVGAFLHVLATASRRAARVTAMLAHQAAGGWARPFAATLPAELPMARVGPSGSAPLAVSHNGRLTGILMPAHMRSVAPDDPVAAAMIPWTPQLTFPAAQPLTRALERLAVSRDGILVVVDENGAAVGVLDHGGVRDRLRRSRKVAQR